MSYQHLVKENVVTNTLELNPISRYRYQHYKSPKPYLLPFQQNILIKETIHELDKSFGKNMK